MQERVSKGYTAFWRGADIFVRSADGKVQRWVPRTTPPAPAPQGQTHPLNATGRTSRQGAYNTRGPAPAHAPRNPFSEIEAHPVQPSAAPTYAAVARNGQAPKATRLTPAPTSQSTKPTDGSARSAPATSKVSQGLPAAAPAVAGPDARHRPPPGEQSAAANDRQAPDGSAALHKRSAAEDAMDWMPAGTDTRRRSSPRMVRAGQKGKRLALPPVNKYRVSGHRGRGNHPQSPEHPPQSAASQGPPPTHQH